jgi:hypothetical protein
MIAPALALLQQVLTSNPTPFVWALEHLSAIGWPVVCLFAWKVSKYFEKASRQIVKTVSQIDSMATNHFPHMEASLSNQDGLLHSMDTSLKTIAANSQRRRENF